MFRLSLALTLLAASFAAAAQPARAQPEKNPATAADTVRYFIDLLKSGDVATASTLSEGISPADLRQAGEQIRSGKTSVSVIDSREDGELAIVIVKVAGGETIEFTGGPLVKREGRWYLARDPEARLDQAGKKRLESLQRWSDERIQELQKALPATRPAR